MFFNPTQEQVLALAAAFQACQLLDNLAKHGETSNPELETAVRSLLNQAPQSTEEVFGTRANLVLGMQSMHELLSPTPAQRANGVLGYVINVMHVERKLTNNQDMLNRIGAGIAQATRQAQHFSTTDERVLASLADLYQQTISTFRFRIQVRGQGGHLQQAQTANRVRCLLFAAIRAALLWRQLGGRRWHLILRRNQVLQQLHRLQSSLQK